jgi:hypothetical protein
VTAIRVDAVHDVLLSGGEKLDGVFRAALVFEHEPAFSQRLVSAVREKYLARAHTAAPRGRTECRRCLTFANVGEP